MSDWLGVPYVYGGPASPPDSAKPAGVGDGHHADGTVPKCPTCEAMRCVPRYPGAWPGDSEPFGHEVTEPEA